VIVSDFLADFAIKGLPVIGAAGAGAWTALRGPQKRPWWHVLAAVGVGWGAGWGASRAVQWLVDRSAPQLPAENTALVGGATGYDPTGGGGGAAGPGADPGATSGIRFVNLDEEKARARAEAIERRRAKRGQKVTIEGGQVVPVGASVTMSAENEGGGSAQASKNGPGTALAVVPLAVKRSMLYSGVRLGKNTLGVSRQSPAASGGK